MSWKVALVKSRVINAPWMTDGRLSASVLSKDLYKIKVHIRNNVLTGRLKMDTCLKRCSTEDLNIPSVITYSNVSILYIESQTCFTKSNKKCWNQKHFSKLPGCMNTQLTARKESNLDEETEANTTDF